MSTIKVDTIATRTGSGNITSSNTIDLNGNELILDVDGDTSLTADTDDQIDIRIGGTDVGTLTQNSGKLTVNSTGTNLSFAVGGTVELNTDGTQFYPQTDNSHNLGTQSLRFKDLYLSSGVFLGGTGAANELDDYEEGTFTPTFGGSGGNPTVSYAVQLGTYIKVGKMVQLTVSVIATGTPSGGSGDLIINGIPFTSKAGIQQAGSVAFTNSLGTASGTTQMTCNIEGGVSYLNVNSHEYSGPSSMSRTEAPAIQNSAPRIVCSICYEAA